MYPTLEDFTTVAAGWKELEENVVYQIVNTKVVHTHGQSVVLSLQRWNVQERLGLWNADNRVVDKSNADSEF